MRAENPTVTELGELTGVSRASAHRMWRAVTRPKTTSDLDFLYRTAGELKSGDSSVSNPLRKAEYRGVLHVGHDELKCFVLEDGTRVISGRSMTSAIGMKGRAQGVSRIAAHSTLRLHIPDELHKQLSSPILFTGSTSRSSNPTQGYEATVLLSICEAILVARDAGALKTEAEQRYATYCDALVRSFAKVGIIALVDEATGYQEVRARDELHQILERYIAKELLPWAKRFPDDFYKEIFRLKRWRYDPQSVKRPGYIGTLTNQLVYEKMPPGVLDELRERNPSNDRGNRRVRHHQLLTTDIGNPHLEKHLSATIALMRASRTWVEFERLFNRSFPGDKGIQEELDLDSP